MERKKAHLERHQRQTLYCVTNQEKVLHRLQARDMHSDVKEPDRQEELVLLERAAVELLTHREEEVAVEVADVGDDGSAVLEEEEAEDVVFLRGGRVRVHADELEEVKLWGRRKVRAELKERQGKGRTPPRVAKSSPR